MYRCCYALQEKKLKEKAKRKAENEKEESDDSEVRERIISAWMRTIIIIDECT